jgi:hypothetical protein
MQKITILTSLSSSSCWSYKKYQNRPPKFTIYVPKLVRHLILQRGRGGGSLWTKEPTKKGKKEGKKTIDGSRRQKFVKPNVP